jgi:hypothetical protein
MLVGALHGLDVGTRFGDGIGAGRAVRKMFEFGLCVEAVHPGSKQQFDDLPPELQDNVDHIDPPLTQHKGDPPVWSEADIQDVIAFLKTLSDGYLPKHSATRISRAITLYPRDIIAIDGIGQIENRFVAR